jgi:putative colanic acid biosynthesis acetyltransferase WcaF
MPSYQRINQFQLPPNFRGRSAFAVQLWWLVQATFFAWSPQFLYGWRRFLLRLFGARIGQKVLIRPSVRITYPWKLTIGDYAWIGDDVELYTLGEIKIGAHSVISQRCYLCTGSHDYSRPTFDIYVQPIHIADQVWLASDVFVAPGVEIGEGAVVGVRSTILHNLPGGMICYGNPAQSVRPRPLSN